MAPHNKAVTLRDIEGGSSQPGLVLVSTAGNTTWSLNLGMWAVLMVAANILHPPAIIMLALNAVLLLLNLDAATKAGRNNTPVWIYVIIGCQILITLQYASWSLSAIF